MTAIELTIPIKTISSPNAREHHMARARRVRAERDVSSAVVSAALCKRPGKLFALSRTGAVITLTRRSAGHTDDDNLQGALKAVRDGIADALGIDDGDPRLTWRYGQERCKRGSWGVRVRIEAKSSTTGEELSDA